MLVSNPELWNQIVNDPYYSNGERPIFEFIQRWATAMENLLNQGKRIAEIADQTLTTCNQEHLPEDDIELAVDVLSQVWLYGSDLANWYEPRRKPKKIFYFVFIPDWLFGRSNN